MEEICDKDVCMGCWACCNICSKNAISMIEDKFGFLHPQINHNLCIDCGACRTVCPNNTLPIFHIEMSTYAAVSKNDDIYKKSTSGGVATTLSTFNYSIYN
ncbi:4Fe-4S dicluster domain-containing protein [Phocaeicola vulgatus]|uniref:4Fe-4S dicluster domain-containing protein n=1 Tax=Phocaeicola vulgatus TaxID=821 RepID=UPI0022E41634|nr:4Fe-4S dicluster domain-containing protein [Phocaeicola vulgatus]